ncbi:MAG: ABC transporter substrate-binding protein [Anaerolineales bacterium]
MPKQQKPIAFLYTFLLVTTLLICACKPTTTPTDEPTSPPPPTDTAIPEPVEKLIETPEPMADQIALTDGFEREVILPEPAQRIVSIAPSNTEILFAIGAGPQVVGRDEFSDYPPEAADITSVGSMYGDLNAENIIALEPDLILAAMINSPEHVQALEDLGLTVFVLPNPMGMDELYQILEMAGKLTGREIEVATLVEGLTVRVDTVFSKLVGAEPVKVYYEVDGTDPNAPWTIGTDTFQDVLIRIAGGENIAADVQGYVLFSLEELVARDPTVMIFSAGPWVTTTPESVSERPGWGDISAVANEEVYGIDANWIDRPGPRMVDALEAMAMILHPERFE